MLGLRGAVAGMTCDCGAPLDTAIARSLGECPACSRRRWALAECPPLPTERPVCELCGGRLHRGKRFCSRECQRADEVRSRGPCVGCGGPKPRTDHKHCSWECWLESTKSDIAIRDALAGEASGACREAGGTGAGYQRHLRAGESPCGPCKRAWAEYKREQRAAARLVLAA